LSQTRFHPKSSLYIFFFFYSFATLKRTHSLPSLSSIVIWMDCIVHVIPPKGQNTSICLKCVINLKTANKASSVSPFLSHTHLCHAILRSPLYLILLYCILFVWSHTYLHATQLTTTKYMQHPTRLNTVCLLTFNTISLPSLSELTFICTQPQTKQNKY
jgi:hypothetical protein